jgi:hypothetical protein
VVSVTVEQQVAERRAIEAPQQHLHGVSAEDLAAIVSQSASCAPRSNPIKSQDSAPAHSVAMTPDGE